MDEAAELLFNFNDTSQNDLMGFSILQEVGEEDVITQLNGQMIEDSDGKGLGTSVDSNADKPEVTSNPPINNPTIQEGRGLGTSLDSDGDKPEITTNPPINNPTIQENPNEEPDAINSKVLGIGLQTSITDMNIEVQKLNRKINVFCKRVSSSNTREDPRVERFLFELELLKMCISQSKNDIRNMASDMEKLMTGKLKSCDDLSPSGMLEDKRHMGPSQVDDLSDVEDGDHEDNRDCDITPLASAQTRPETTVKTAKGRKKPAKKVCKTKTKLDSKTLSVKRLQRSGVKFQKGEPKFKCHLCGAVTEKGNDHMKEKHPDEKEFPCSECDEKFDDFESMCYHKVTHKQNKAKSGEQVLPSNFQCDKCGKICKTTRTLRQHMMIHFQWETHLCEVCGKEFLSRQSAQRCKHEKGNNPHGYPLTQESCGICGETFRNRHLLKIHLRELHGVQAVLHYPCLICDEILYLKVDLHDHLDLHSSNVGQPLKCKVCDESFVNPFKLREHILDHNKKFVCDFCGKKFFKAGTLEKHRKFHSEQVTCQVCGRIFRSQRNLEEHMNKHTGEKPFECDICHKKLVSSSALDNHKNRMHSVNNGGIKCVICGMIFKTTFKRNTHHLSAHTEEERRLHDVVVPMFNCDICGETVRNEFKAVHLKTHKSEEERKQNVCEICGSRFAYISELKEHMFEIHNDKDNHSVLAMKRADKKVYYHGHYNGKQYVCSICGKAYVTKTQLKVHEKIHYHKHGTKNYKCDVCGKGFNYKMCLDIHHRTHTGERPFTCKVCGLSFTCKGNMLRHISATHMKERRFQCEFCNKYFAQKTSLITHRRIHTGEKPFSCSICGRFFSDPSTLYKHKRLHENK